MRYRINFRSDQYPSAYAALSGAIGSNYLDVPFMPSYAPIADLLTASIPDELHQQLAELVVIERNAIETRKKLLRDFRESFHQTAVELTADILNTHPELFI